MPGRGATKPSAPYVRESFVRGERTHGARRVWHDVLAEGLSYGVHRIEPLMRAQVLRAKPRCRRRPADIGERSAVAPNVLDRAFVAERPNRKWDADFTCVWTADGWLYVAVVLDLFSRRMVGWSMKAEMRRRSSPTRWSWRSGGAAGRRRCCITLTRACSGLDPGAAGISARPASG
jgi:transposase InsO family protein